jgi:hypothetical protein
MLLRRHLLTGAVALSAQPKQILPLGDAANFYYGEEWDKPFLYPLRTVSGKILSRRYPIETVPGEETDHAWHRGLWYGHGIINGHDFWREQGRDKTSRLIINGKPRTKTKAVDATFHMVTPTGQRLGSMVQGFVITDRGPHRYIDSHIQINADQKEPLTFGDTDDGGFAFRLNDQFREDRGAHLRNSSGLQGTNKIWGQAAYWVDYSSVIDGRPTGVAIFDHPQNLRHPTQWHARGYSLCAANPFASKSFSKNKGPDGAYTLPAGQGLTLRYRVLIHEGPCEPHQIESLYKQWAKL